MKDQFLPYELAAQLKELGFNLPTLGHYYERNGEQNLVVYGEFAPDTSKWIAAPLYQQALEWFRTAHNLNGLMAFKANIKKWDFIVYNMRLNGKEYVNFYSKYYRDHPNRQIDSHREAELLAIKEMIQLAQK